MFNPLIRDPASTPPLRETSPTDQLVGIPQAHGHAIADMAGLQAALDAKAVATLSNVSNSDFVAKATAAGVGGGGAALGSAMPHALGAAAAGTAASAAREDHVHAMPSAAQVGAAAVSHPHAISDTTGLQAALNAKAALAGPQTFTGAQRGVIVALSASGTITPNFNDGNYFAYDISGNVTFALPQNLVGGQGGAIFINRTTDGTTSFAAGWLFPGGIKVASTVAGAKDRIDYVSLSTSVVEAAITRAVS